MDKRSSGRQPTVVDALPAGIHSGPIAIAIAAVSATTKPCVTVSQLNAFENDQLPRLAGQPSWSDYVSPSNSRSYDIEVTVHEPNGSAAAVVALLSSSGLFTDIQIDT